MEDVRNWLNGSKDYQTGIQLYLKYGDNDLLKRLLTQEGHSEYKFTRLVNALQQMLLTKKDPAKKETPAKAVQLVTPKKETIKEIPIEKNWSEKKDTVEQSLFLQWKQTYSEMMNLCARVGELSKEASEKNDKSKIDEAGRMALKILDLDDQCDRLYSDRDFYKANGRLPDEENPIEISLDSTLWHKKLQNHERYARKFNGRIEKDPTDTAAALLMQKHQWAIGEYKKLLKMD